MRVGLGRSGDRGCAEPRAAITIRMWPLRLLAAVYLRRLRDSTAVGGAPLWPFAAACGHCMRQSPAAGKPVDPPSGADPRERCHCDGGTVRMAACGPCGCCGCTALCVHRA